MEPESAGSVSYRHRKDDPRHKRSTTIGALFIVIALVAAIGIWNSYWRVPKIEPASKDKMAFPLPDKPSIAVLPFSNMSDDKEQEYFADGLAEERINGLSKVEHVFAISRFSTFTYKGKPVKVQQVAEELGVRYVLEGSVRKSGDKVRITTQLVDALTGRHIFSERYDRDFKDILTVQDEITIDILVALQVALTRGEEGQIMAKGTRNLEAYLRFLKANQFINQFNKEGVTAARRYAEEVLALDPEFAGGYCVLSGVIIKRCEEG